MLDRLSCVRRHAQKPFKANLLEATVRESIKQGSLLTEYIGREERTR